MLTLFYAPRTRSTRVRWMLEELGVPYELHRVDIAGREHKRPEYLAEVHPLGHVPALRDGDLTLFESVGIIEWLADRYPDKGLAPPPGSRERGPYLQWIHYIASEVEPSCWTHWLQARVLPEPDRLPGLAAKVRVDLNRNLVALEGCLADGRPFLLGERFSAADVVGGWTLNWAFLQKMVDGCPHTEAWSRRLLERPANQRARAD